jgi:hypothetical protein
MSAAEALAAVAKLGDMTPEAAAAFALGFVAGKVSETPRLWCCKPAVLPRCHVAPTSRCRVCTPRSIPVGTTDTHAHRGTVQLSMRWCGKLRAREVPVVSDRSVVEWWMGGGGLPSRECCMVMGARSRWSGRCRSRSSRVWWQRGARQECSNYPAVLPKACMRARVQQ